MKKSILFAGLMVAGNSMASQALMMMPPSREANLEHMELADSFKGVSKPVSAEVKIDGINVTLTLHRHPILCVRAPCPQPDPIVISLPIISEKTVSGVEYTRALLDRRMVDGAREELLVTDRSLSAQNSMLPVVEVRYSVQSLRQSGAEVSRFSSEKGFARTGIHPSLMAMSTLNQFDVDSKLHLSDSPIERGFISLNTDSLVLNLKPMAIECAQFVGGPDCKQPEAIEISIPRTTTVSNDCGEVTYTATRDSRRVDGALETLVLVDHTESKCANDSLKGHTEVRYTTSTLRGPDTESKFEGGALAHIYHTMRN